MPPIKHCVRAKWRRKERGEFMKVVVAAIEEYVCEGTSLVVLSEKYGVSISSINIYLSYYYGRKPTELNLESKIND
jgi:hypothetical protein